MKESPRYRKLPLSNETLLDLVLRALVQAQHIVVDAASDDIGLDIASEMGRDSGGGLDHEVLIDLVEVRIIPILVPIVGILGEVDVLAVNPLVQYPRAGSVALAVHEQTIAQLRIGFVWDDGRLVQRNAHRRKGLRGLDPEGVIVGLTKRVQTAPILRGSGALIFEVF